ARGRIARLHRPSRDRAPDSRAVLAHLRALKVLRLAAPDRLVHGFAARRELLVAVEHEARRAAGELPGTVAEDLLEAPVAAQDGAVLGENDADKGVLQDRVLLAHHALERLVGALPLGDVLQQPDVALGRLACLHGAAA